MEYKLIKASKEDKTLLYNMMQLYYYELSKYEDESAIFELNDKGIYEIRYFDLYWTKKNRFPYLLKANDKNIGLVLVREREDGYIEIAEFFILNKYKGKGAGRFMANAIFDLHKGKWEIGALMKNISAQNFWRKIIKERMINDYEEKYIKNNTRLAWYFSNK